MDDWLNGVLSSSAMQEEYYTYMVPDDSSGWGEVLDRMWFSDPDVRPTGTGVLLTGPEGSGRHTAAAHLIRRLTERSYALAVLRGADLRPDEGDLKAQLHRLNSLLDHFLEQKQGLCLVVEDLMDSPCGRECAQWLGEMLCFYFLRRGPDFISGGPRDAGARRDLAAREEQLEPLFLICIEPLADSVPSLLRSRLQHCRMSLPDRQQRTAFARSHRPDFIPDRMSLDDFVQWTEGFSYAQLEDLIHTLAAVPGGDPLRLDALLESQRPVPPIWERAYALAAELLAELPELLRCTPAATDKHAVPSQTSQPVKLKPTKGKGREDFEKLPGDVLYAGLPEEHRQHLEELLQKMREPMAER